MKRKRSNKGAHRTAEELYRAVRKAPVPPSRTFETQKDKPRKKGCDDV